MNKIKVKILDHSFNGMPMFLAKLTQRGSQVTTMEQLMELYDDNIKETPSPRLLGLPHDTISRMCYMTVAICGLSTKAVSQLRTHATRLTFISTSTQYSEFTKVDDPYVIPMGLNDDQRRYYETAMTLHHAAYQDLHKDVGDKDTTGYMLPQSLRKSLIVSGHFPAWRYVLQLRSCNRNTKETKYISELIIEAMRQIGLGVWADLCLPRCTTTLGCPEGNFTCGEGIWMSSL